MYRGAGARWQPNYMVLERPDCCRRDFVFSKKQSIGADAGCEGLWCLAEVWREERTLEELRLPQPVIYQHKQLRVFLKLAFIIFCCFFFFPRGVCLMLSPSG